jgi:hypothetical protein
VQVRVLVYARAAIEIEFFAASSSRHRNVFAASSSVGTDHTRQSNTGNRSAYSAGRNAGSRRLKCAVHRAASVEVIFWMRRSKKICASNPSGTHARVISSDCV